MYLGIFFCPSCFIFCLFLLGFWLLAAGKPITLKHNLTYFCVFDCYILFSFGHPQNHQSTLFDLHNPSSDNISFFMFSSVFFPGCILTPKINFASYPPLLSSWGSLPLTFLILPSKIVLANYRLSWWEWRCRFSPRTSPKTFQRNYFTKLFKKNIYPLAGGCYPTIRLARHLSNFIFLWC